MRERQAEFDAAGVRLAAISLGDANYGRLFREETGITFPLLIDDKRAAYKAAELQSGSLAQIFWKVNGRARKRARRRGYRQHKTGRNPFQLGGSFVFAPGGELLFGHVSRTFGDNAEPQQLLDALQRRR